MTIEARGAQPSVPVAAAGGRPRLDLLAGDPLRREARLERLHQVHDLRARALGCGRDLTAFDLALDRLAVALAHLVLVALRMELVARDLLDDLDGELQLRLAYLGVLDRHVTDRPYLVGVEQLLHHQSLARRPDQHQVLLASGGPAGERRASGLLHRLAQQPIGLGSSFVGAEVVGAVEVHGVHGRGGHELRDLDGLLRLLGHRLQLLLAEDHVLFLRELVALDHLVARHGLAVLRAHVLLLEAALALGVEQVERHGRGRLPGGIEPNRDRDHAEGEGPRGNRAGRHTSILATTRPPPIEVGRRWLPEPAPLR